MLPKLFISSAILAVMLSAQSTGAFASGKGRSLLHQIEIEGVLRSYILYRPPLPCSSRDTGKLPLMIVLHGGLGNAESIQRRSGMDAVADTGFFLVAYPNGTGLPATPELRTWNAGGCCGPAARQKVNDVLFIERVIEDAVSRFNADATRIYIAGLSNGAMLAYRLACEIPRKIAAIIPVAGTLAVGSGDGAREVAVLHIHGDRDDNVPFHGGMGRVSRAGVPHRSVPDTIRLMTEARQCTGVTEKNLEGGIRWSSYRCSRGAPFELLLVKNGVHEWPGGEEGGGRGGVDRIFCASLKAWEFARQFSKEPSGALIINISGPDGPQGGSFKKKE